jgi:hypothetical protein
MRLVPLERAHLAALDAGVFDRASIAPLQPAALKPEGIAYTALDSCTVLGCAGLLPSGPQQATAWALFSDALRARPFALHRMVRYALRDLPSATGITHLQASVHPAFPAARRWLLALGFTPHGRRRHPSTQEIYEVFEYVRS